MELIFLKKEDAKMQVDYDLKRKRESQIEKNDSSIVENSKRSDLISDLDNFSNDRSNSNKLKRQKLL